MTIDFMGPEEPNFIFKKLNAVQDMGLTIESELPEYSPKPRVQEIQTLGRSGSLHEWHGDYEPYDFTIKNVTCDYERIDEIKAWLRGSGRLITHNDSDKYRDVHCNISSPTQYQNEWGLFYAFDITFRSQPFRKRLSEPTMKLTKGKNIRHNPGNEISKPNFWLETAGGDFNVTIGDRTLEIIGAFSGTVEINTEFGKVTQSGTMLRKKGQWPLSPPGINEIILGGNVSGGLVKLEAVYL